MAIDGRSAEERAERQLEVASLLLESARGQQFNAVVFNKAMFYADLVALRDIGRTVSGSDYTAAPKGPMLTNFKKIVERLHDSGIAEQIEDGMAQPIRLIRPVRGHHLIEREIAIVKQVGAKCSSWTSARASDFSHENQGWTIGLGADKRRINLVIAMQQVVDDDEWLDEPLSADEHEAVGRGVVDAHPWN